MPINLSKKYPQLLELMHLSLEARIDSLRKIFMRDIENNINFRFLQKNIRPIKNEDGQPAMDTLFQHLTHESEKVTDDKGRFHKSRNVFDMDRSQRLHWIKYLTEMQKRENIEVFTVMERNQKDRKDVARTYLYDIEQKYVIVFEPHRSNLDYYLLSAYFLNKSYGEGQIKKKLKQKIPEIL